MSTTVPAAAPAAVKPRARGWIHVYSAVIATAMSLALIPLAGVYAGAGPALACSVYALTLIGMFTVSATYHRHTWKSPRTRTWMRRADHSMIFVFIAGTYTPLALTLLDGASRATLLILVWSIAVVGVIFRTTWLNAPRWLYTALYLAMGWAAVGWLNQFWVTGGAVVVTLLVLGGLVYSLGAVAYATKRPALSPAWFGFHEVFHSCTIIAAILHATAIGIALF